MEQEIIVGACIGTVSIWDKGVDVKWEHQSFLQQTTVDCICREISTMAIPNATQTRLFLLQQWYRRPNWPHDDHQDSWHTPSCQNCLDQRCLVNLVMNIAWCAVHSSILHKSSRENTSNKQISLTDVAYMEDYSLATCPVLGYSNQSWNQCQ